VCRGHRSQGLHSSGGGKGPAEKLVIKHKVGDMWIPINCSNISIISAPLSALKAGTQDQLLRHTPPASHRISCLLR